MEIIIKDTKLLFIYRLMPFNIVKFKTNKKEYQKIVKFLNIKNKRKRIEYIYDEAIKEIDKYYPKDLCDFKDGRCIYQRYLKTDRVNGCCRSCHLSTDKGCPTTNLPCKIIYCSYINKKIKPLKYKDINILKCLSLKQQLILKGNFYSTREEIINDLHYGFIYSCIHEIKKDFRIFLHLQKMKKYK
ncbi:MAG: hypothetical protein VZS44_03505 [Bacilli bacterium]|nr:hypothetical protein [Bacilli bacterium]